MKMGIHLIGVVIAEQLWRIIAFSKTKSGQESSWPREW
jgi:hypothetical protein